MKLTAQRRYKEDASKASGILICVFAIFWFLSIPHSYAANGDNRNFQMIEIDQNDLVANLYLPNGSIDLPVVIVIGGSSGGMRTEYGELLANNGIGALTLAYFRYKDLPPTLDNIPVEYVHNAIDYLETVEAINSSRIGVWGASRGSELAFLAASSDQRIKSLAVTTPSKVAWHGAKTPSAWTYKKKKIPSLTFDRRDSSPIIERSSNALDNTDKANAAQFSFEKINGPILLISAEKDHIWPSFQMANDIEEYLNKHKFKYSVKHNSYPTGHFFNEKVRPVVHNSIIEHFKLTLHR